MTNKNPDILKEKLHELFIVYSQQLPERLKKIRTTWEKLQSHFDRQEWLDFYREVHSLTGSSGTYGYEELCKTIGELGLFLRTRLDCTELTEEEQQTITQLIGLILRVPLVSSQFSS